jgi:GNAT superfamily N-acetyltransferase
MDKIDIIRCDFSNPVHCRAEIDLLREYMTDKMGDVPPLNEEENIRLIEGLKHHPTLLTLLARYKNEYVGMTNSFVNFATFSARKFLNIHDFFVKSSCRGLGIGKKLMEENIRVAREELDCSKITLEVRKDNVIAQQLYKSSGFNEADPSMYFWVKYLN